MLFAISRHHIHRGDLMIFKSMLLSGLVLASLICNSHAEQFQTLKTSEVSGLQDPYFQVKSMKIQPIADDEMSEFNFVARDFVGNIPNLPSIPSSGATPGVGIGGIISIIDQLIAIGQKIIPIIKQGAPVVTNNPMTSVSVLPRIDAKDPVVHDMSGWSVPKSNHYKVTFQNGFGSDVVTFIYSISYQFNGTLDGQGKYLAGIRASATNIIVSWGFDLDASSQLLQISNVGTKQNVIAAATLEMTYTVKNWTRNITTSNSFFVTGDGRFIPLD